MSDTSIPLVLSLPARAWQCVARRFRRPRFGDMVMLALMLLVILGGAVVAMWLLSSAAQAMPLTAGDRLHVLVESGEEFSGKYQVDVGGRIRLPYAGPVTVAGLEPDAAAAVVADRLVAAGIFRRSFVRATVQVLAWAPLEVNVSGAVFYPGMHRVNLPPSRERAPDRAEEIPGASLPERRLSDALRAAGGVTPWADLAHVAVRREGQTRLYDLWPLMRGQPCDDPALMAGDEVLVPVLPESQAGLARPSAVTPPGVKIFVSNLIQPAQSNAQATASGGNLSLAYGSRFSQAVVAANCVGGLVPTGANRAAVLVRTDRLNGTTRTWDSPVEDLIRRTDDSQNPVLLEGDAVACYDSTVAGVRDVFRAIADVLSPLAIFRRGN